MVSEGCSRPILLQVPVPPQVQGHRYEEDLQALRQQVEKLQQRKARLQADMDGEEDARDQFHRQKVLRSRGVFLASTEFAGYLIVYFLFFAPLRALF